MKQRRERKQTQHHRKKKDSASGTNGDGIHVFALRQTFVASHKCLTGYVFDGKIHSGKICTTRSALYHAEEAIPELSVELFDELVAESVQRQASDGHAQRKSRTFVGLALVPHWWAGKANRTRCAGSRQKRRRNGPPSPPRTPASLHPDNGGPRDTYVPARPPSHGVLAEGTLCWTDNKTEGAYTSGQQGAESRLPLYARRNYWVPSPLSGIGSSTLSFAARKAAQAKPSTQSRQETEKRGRHRDPHVETTGQVISP